MNGLILKDIYNLNSTWKVLVALAAFYTVFGLMTDNGQFMVTMIILVCAMQFISTFSYDKISGFETYALTLCVTRRDIVKARYAAVAIMLLTSIGLSAVFSIVMFVLGAFDGSIGDQLLSVSVVVSIGILFDAILLPLIYKFGVEKSRIMMFAVCLLPAAVVWGALKLGLVITEQMVKAFATALPFAAVLLFVLSYFISQQMYAKREF